MTHDHPPQFCPMCGSDDIEGIWGAEEVASLKCVDCGQHTLVDVGSVVGE